MCCVWDGKIERCLNCSEQDFQTVLRANWKMEPAQKLPRLATHMAQHPMNQGQPQWSRHDPRMGLLGDSTNEIIRDQEQDLTLQVRPFPLRRDARIIHTAHNKRQRTNEDPTSSSMYEASSNGTAQRKRPKTDAEQHSSSIHNTGVEKVAQHGQQGMNAIHAYYSRQGARTTGTAQIEQQAIDQNLPSSSMPNTCSAWANGRGREESHQSPPSSSRHHAITDLTGEDQHQGASQLASQKHPRVEDTEALTPGMKTLSLPSWEETRVILPLVQEQLSQEEYYRRQEQELDDIWGPYAKEREALAALHTPEVEEIWIPEFEEAEILERAIPLEEEIWANSVLVGENWMRTVLDEDENWPRNPPEEANIWKCGEGGNLNSGFLKKLLHVLTLEKSIEKERLEEERHDEERHE